MKAIPEGMTITGYGRAIKLFLLKGFTQDFSQGWQDFLLPPLGCFLPPPPPGIVLLKKSINTIKIYTSKRLHFWVLLTL